MRRRLGKGAPIAQGRVDSATWGPFARIRSTIGQPATSWICCVVLPFTRKLWSVQVQLVRLDAAPRKDGAR